MTRCTAVSYTLGQCDQPEGHSSTVDGQDGWHSNNCDGFYAERGLRLDVVSGELECLYTKRRWLVESRGDGWLIVPRPDGALPPAGAEDALEVRAAEIAAAEFDYHQRGCAANLYGSIGVGFGPELGGWLDYLESVAASGNDELPGWLAAQIVNGDGE